MTLLKVLIFALVPICLRSVSEMCPYWKDIVRSPGFGKHVIQVFKMSYLHVGLPPEFGEEETRLFSEFLKATPISLRVFTHEEGLCNESICEDPSTRLHTLLLVVCREHVWMQIIISKARMYNLHLYVFCESLSVRGTVATRLIDGNHMNSSPLDVTDVFNITVRHQKVVLGRYDQVTCLDCASDHQNEDQFKLVQNLPLKRNLIIIKCEYPYFCKSPSIAVLKSIILHKNASFKLDPFSTHSQYLMAIRMCCQDPKCMLYFNWVISHHTFFPALYPIQHYESLGYEYYVKGPEPLVKEVVLLLPLSGYVWIAVVATCAVSLLTCTLIFKVLHLKTKVFSFVCVLLLSSLLQRSYPVPSRVTQLTSLRIMLGVWFSTVTIISTAYIGVLTSLLGNIPMSGTPPEFTPNSTPISQGFRFCILTYPLDEGIQFPQRPGHKFGAECMSPYGKIYIGNDGKDVFGIFGSGFSKPDKLKNQLITRGYVRTSSDTSAIVNGPQMKHTSPYRAQLREIVGRAFQAGLFLRASQMAEFNRTRRRVSQIESDPLRVELLKLHELRPFFVILGVGLCLCGLALFCEFIA